MPKIKPVTTRYAFMLISYVTKDGPEASQNSVCSPYRLGGPCIELSICFVHLHSIAA